MTDITRYPLSWPFGWPRTKSIRRSGFGQHSVQHCVTEIERQLALLSGRSIVISSNLLLRQDGLPRSGQIQPADRGVAVYFRLQHYVNGKSVHDDRVLACDRWDKVEDNMWAIARHIDALRSQKRWGVGSVEQAFAGYQALPAPADNWWDVLAVNRDADDDTIKSAYRAKAKLTHPDAGGNTAEFDKVQRAYEKAVQS